MKALVGVKRVLDYAIKVRVNAEKTGIATKGLKMSMNPFDEIAVEEALKLREAGKVSEVVALSIGDKQ
jgi:electron transfer flavoprotein beta subunit